MTVGEIGEELDLAVPGADHPFERNPQVGVEAEEPVPHTLIPVTLNSHRVVARSIGPAVAVVGEKTGVPLLGELDDHANVGLPAIRNVGMLWC